jgi:lipoprotein NlpD
MNLNVMRMNKLSLISLVSLLSILGACSTTQNSAPILERNGGGQIVEVPNTVAPANVTPLPPSGPGYYTVKKGDTLSHIALDNGQNYRDLVTWNNLANPNDIKVDQVLRVLPPGDSAGNAQVSGIPVPDSGVRTPLAPLISNKSGPRGDKRPYSEATLAELQKPETQMPVVAIAATGSSTIAPTVADKTAQSAVAEEVVSWMWPADGKLLGPYEESKKGIDIAGKSGQQVAAAASGKVLYAGTMRGYGNLVIVKHSTSLLSAYAHNKVILVKEGQAVTKGQAIAEMGDSDTDSIKLHFEVRQQGKPVDPAKFLPAR